MNKTVLVFMMVTLMAFAIAACDGGEDPAVSFCDALTELNETAPAIVALGDAADLAQIVQLGTALDNNWQALSSAAEDMDDATQTAFDSYDELYASIPAITQETAMPVARASLDAKNAIVTDAYNEFYPGQCQ
jgi:hypothetical protein